uniref:Uncharacterized protein LOC111099929 isoform X5 n=1 Tax=Crassostrea virginica TaxID=6565 RepID=A0A8B8A7N1_CRAVI|nr:uncharacterized protein LOC111099929 isoform X5 [Crassostrea virginica]
MFKGTISVICVCPFYFAYCIFFGMIKGTISVICDTENNEVEVSCERKNNVYKKPDRYCVYCKCVIHNGKLKRHIIRKHKTEPEIIEILKKDKATQNIFFDRKRKDGIYEFNVELISENKDPSMRERQANQKDQLRVCTSCKCFVSSRFFYKHKCIVPEPDPLKPALLQKAKSKIDQDPDFREILNSFRDGKVGALCRSDPFIKLIGFRHFNLRKHEKGKENEVKRVVMAEMRELARLFLTFCEISGESETNSLEIMFSRNNLQDLYEAIQQQVSIVDDKMERKEKHGQKLFLNAIILRSIKALHGHYAETMQDLKAKELKNFKDAYKFKSCELFSSARQMCVKNSMEKLRRPENLPKEMDIQKLKWFIHEEISQNVTNFSVERYAWLRTLIVSRLTLFNARRGEEASRMLRTEWEDAERNVWVPQEQVANVEDSAEKFLVGQFKLAYLKGKGKKFVPVLVPKDLVPGIRLLIENRTLYGIPVNNPFLFGTKSEKSHCSGWHALREVCHRADISLITAGKMRHRLSSIYASLHMLPHNQEIFLDHMGHEKGINKENYQCPAGVRTLRVMGRMLTDADEGGNVSKAIQEESDADGENDMDDQEELAAESAEIDVDDDIDVSDEKITPKTVKWSKEDTATLRIFFQTYISTQKENNTGNLPRKNEIEDYLRKTKVTSLVGLDMKTKIHKIKTKIFNERKTSRERVSQKLSKLMSN